MRISAIAHLSDEINALRVQARKSRQSVVLKDKEDNDVCFFHKKYGSKGFKSQKPCNWNKTRFAKNRSENGRGFQ